MAVNHYVATATTTTTPTIATKLEDIKPTAFIADIPVEKSVSTLNNINLNEKAKFTLLSQILGLTHNDFKELKLLDLNLKDLTYLESIQKILTHLKTTKASETVIKSAAVVEDLEVSDIVKLKLLQEISHKKAQTKALYSKMALEEGKYILIEELVEALQPMVMTIRSCLVSIRHESDGVKEQVDVCLTTLRDLGLRLVAKAADEDKARVDELMAARLDINEIIADSGITK